MCNYGQAIFQKGIAQTVFNYMQNKGVCIDEAIRTLVTDEENAAACRYYIEERILPNGSFCYLTADQILGKRFAYLKEAGVTVDKIIKDVLNMCYAEQAAFLAGIAHTVFHYMKSKGVCIDEAIRTLVPDEKTAMACQQYIEEHLLHTS